MKTRSLATIAASAGIACASGAASAGTVTFGFFNISGNSATNAAAGEAQLRVAVSMLAGNQVGFHFYHDGLTPMSMTQIYFDDNLTRLGTAGAPVGSAGVSFAAGGSPPNLPAANNADPDFGSNVRFTASSPTQPNGVNPTETLDLSFLINGDFDALIDDIFNGDLRIGVHVQGFADGGSEAFLNEPICIDPINSPLPSAAGLGLVGLGVIAARRRR